MIIILPCCALCHANKLCEVLRGPQTNERGVKPGEEIHLGSVKGSLSSNRCSRAPANISDEKGTPREHLPLCSLEVYLYILVHTREKNQPSLPELPGFKFQNPLNSPLTKPPLLLLAQAQPTRNIGVYVLCSPARGWSLVALKHEAHPIDGASWLLDGGTRCIYMLFLCLCWKGACVQQRFQTNSATAAGPPAVSTVRQQKQQPTKKHRQHQQQGSQQHGDSRRGGQSTAGFSCGGKPWRMFDGGTRTRTETADIFFSERACAGKGEAETGEKARKPKASVHPAQH